MRAFQRRGHRVISVDAKKKELVGDFKNGGREWQPQGAPEPVRTHDFEDKRLGKVTPYGVYDPTHNAGWVSVGIDHDTWWRRLGLAAVVMLGLVALRGATRGKDAGVAKEVLARRFVLVSEDGKTGGVQDVSPSGRLGQVLLDKAGVSRASIHINPDGSPGIGLTDANGRASAGLGVGPDGTAFILFTNADRKGCLALGLNASHQPSLTMYNEKGTEETTVLGETELLLRDSDGNIRIVLSVESALTGLIVLDRTGKIVRSVP